jgi:hypothetical protein
MGVAGTSVAYIVQVVDVFRDIEIRMGKPVSIATRDDGKKMETLPSRPRIKSDMSHLPTGFNAIQEGPKIRQRSSSNFGSDYNSGSSVFSHGSTASSSTAMSTSTATGALNTDLHYPAPTLPCEFVGYGYCDETFDLDDVDSWINHIISQHLDNHLPKKAVCWFCDDYSFDFKDVNCNRRHNFDNRMYHIREHILEERRMDSKIRPDHHLNDHLRKYGLISDDAYIHARRYDEIAQSSWI